MANEKRRLIDANALFSEIERRTCLTCNYEDGMCQECPYGEVADMLVDAPTVDAVEVVRCKDCKHWKPSGSMAGNNDDDLQPIGGCIWANCCRRANDFCSYGEREGNV